MLIETFEKLYNLAKSRGYTNDDLDLLTRAYTIAADYSKNRFRYRIKNRPFIHHLVSVCAILIEFNANIETVIAGLLHSVNNDMPTIYNLNYNVGEIVNNYFDITTKEAAMRETITFDNINKTQSAIIIIQLANHLDMIQSGEIL